MHGEIYFIGYVSKTATRFNLISHVLKCMGKKGCKNKMGIEIIIFNFHTFILIRENKGWVRGGSGFLLREEKRKINKGFSFRLIASTIIRYYNVVSKTSLLTAAKAKLSPNNQGSTSYVELGEVIILLFHWVLMYGVPHHLS